MDEEDEHEQHPAEVYPVDLRLARVLHEKRDTAEEPRKREADHHAHDDAYVRKDRRIGLHLLHECGPYCSDGTGVGLPVESSATITKIASVTFSMTCER